MQKFTYLPPKIKDSTRLIDVIDEQGNVKCKFRRTYKNFITRIVTYLCNFDWYVQFDVYSNDNELVYKCKKLTKWIGKPDYRVINCKTNEVFNVIYKSWHVVVPELLITNDSAEYLVKKELRDWARLYYQGREVARWKMKTTEWFMTYIEIEEECPIQEPEFFIGLFQAIFYVGDFPKSEEAPTGQASRAWYFLNQLYKRMQMPPHNERISNRMLEILKIIF